MSNRLLALATHLALVFAIAVGMQSYAQSQPGGQSDSNAQANPAPPPGHGMHRGPGMNADEQLEHMSRMLNLTDAQKTQIKPILEDMHKQRESIRADSSLSPQDRRSKMHSATEEGHARIRALLTDEQKQKLDQMHEHRGGHMPRPPAGASH